MLSVYNQHIKFVLGSYVFQGRIGDKKLDQLRKKAIADLENALDRKTVINIHAITVSGQFQSSNSFAQSLFHPQFQTQRDGLREKELDIVRRLMQWL